MFWSYRLSVSGHMLIGVFQIVSDIQIRLMCLQICLEDSHVSTQHSMGLRRGKQAQSVTEILLQTVHTLFILDSAAKERQLRPPL